MTQSQGRWRGYRKALAAGGVVLLSVVLWVLVAAVVYTPEYVRRVLVWQQSDQGDYLDGFPLSPLERSPTPHAFSERPDPETVRAGFEQVLGVDDFDRFLADNSTQAFIVIQGDALIYEQYFNGASRDSMLTSFSVAKSFVSALVGIAIDEGFISSVDDPVTDYLPELERRDSRFSNITIRDLLQMSSGLEYSANRWALFNGDDPLTSYYTDQRELALENTQIEGPPGLRFSYNKYHPQLLGLVLERTTGVSVTEFTQTRLWDQLGMEFDGAWALDRAGGFEKMEAGLNGRAVDYAKLGVLYRDEGMWSGNQVVPLGWITASTSPDSERDRTEYYDDEFGQAVFAEGNGYYGFMWYGRLRNGEVPDFAAEGDHGQFIYVSPSRDLVIVRNGESFGLPPDEWIDAFHAFAGLPPG